MTTCGRQVAAMPTGAFLKQTSLSVQSGDQWQMEPAVVGPKVPRGRLLGMTLGNHLPDGSELVPEASPWLSSPGSRGLGSRLLVEGWAWPGRASGGCCSRPAPGRTTRESHSSQAWKGDQPRRRRDMYSPERCWMISIPSPHLLLHLASLPEWSRVAGGGGREALHRRRAVAEHGPREGGGAALVLDACVGLPLRRRGSLKRTDRLGGPQARPALPSPGPLGLLEGSFEGGRGSRPGKAQPSGK